MGLLLKMHTTATSAGGGVSPFSVPLPPGRRFEHILLPLLAIAWLLFGASPVRASPQDIMAGAVKSYMAGHVLDAEQQLQSGLSTAASPTERWAMIDLLTDLCTYAFDYECIASSLKPMQEIGEKLAKPDITAAKSAYVYFFYFYLTNNTLYFKDNANLDFSLKLANPLANPVLAARLFLLNAAIVQDTGDFSSAHRYLDRAFASLLQVDPRSHSFEIATLLKSLIEEAVLNHDTARAWRWFTVANPLIEAGLPKSSYDYSDYLSVQVQLAERLDLNPDVTEAAMRSAIEATSRLQIRAALKSAALNTLAVNEAAEFSLRGDNESTRKAIQSAPLYLQKDELLKRGVFGNPIELMYATAEIFFDTLGGSQPDQRWRPLFQKLPDWILASDQQVESRIFGKTAMAFLDLKSDPQSAVRAILEASRADLAQFEVGRADIKAFPLPSLLDRVLLSVAALTVPPLPDKANADLLLGEMELIDRNPNYIVSDTLAAMSDQGSVEKQHVVHALLRLNDQQEKWEQDQLRSLVDRKNDPAQPGGAADFSAQFTAIEFANTEDRLRRAITEPATTLPKIEELQAALQPDEAFLGMAMGLRICVRKTTVQTFRYTFDPKQFGLDVKLLTAALSAQNQPSDVLDSQYPVSAALRLYHLIFDGTAECTKGIRHLVYFSPAQLTGVPISALLHDEPAKTKDGYDLGGAHWVLFDFAVSTVSSVREFLSARKLSLKLQGRTQGLNFLGIGDPTLGGSEYLKSLAPLPEARTEVLAISKEFGRGTNTVLGADATEEAFRSFPLDQYEVLHFATHGLLRDESNGVSEAALVFSPGDEKDPFNDGLLTARDVANLNLSARLIVLSACNTANVDLHLFGSQLQGLASSFAAAGTPTTIASEWAVNSEGSTMIMTRFYQLLLGPDHYNVAEALQKAMIALLQQRPSIAFAHPRFWAPFVVLGDGGEGIVNMPNGDLPLSKVQLSASGGEVLDLTVGKTAGSYFTSSIGPSVEGRHVSLIEASPPASWVVQDPKIGAGRIAGWKGTIYAGGYTWDGKSTPVVRAFSEKGKLLWEKPLTSRFQSAALSSVEAGPRGLFFVVAPFETSPDSIEFDVLRFDFSGKETGRREVTSRISATARNASLQVSFAAALSGDDLIVAVSYAPTAQTFFRSDFGYPSICNSGSGARLYKISGRTLSIENEITAPDLRINALQNTGGYLSFAGAQHELCGINAEKAVTGKVNADFKLNVVWKDDGPFFSHAVGVVQQGEDVIVAEQIEEPVAIPSYPGGYSAIISADPKFIPGTDANLSEMVAVRLGPEGVKEKIFLGNGLPQSANGIALLGKSVIIFGSNGFNPWKVTLH